MSYVVSGLSAEPFRPLFGLSDGALSALGATRLVADGDGPYPCRVTLEDAKPGERLLLVNFEHLPAPQSPYRSRYAIFVNEAAGEAARFENRLPPVLATRRLIALRAYDEAGFMLDADIVPGPEVEASALRLLEDPKVAYLHAHNPARGCYAARIDRA
jgi:hypothetical protein